MTVLQAEPWFKDPKCIELPWREEHVESIKSTRLNIGLIKWDQFVMPHPPVQRGIRIVEDALKSQGHDVIEFSIPDSREAHDLSVCSFSSWIDLSFEFIVLTEERISLMHVRYLENLLFRTCSL